MRVPRAHRALRTAVVWEAVQDVLDGRGDDALDVLDVGGGTGGFAVPLAELGHRVTVVDPSPDALASLERRAGDVRVAVRAVQGDAAGLAEVAEPGSVDLVLCHGVLEHVDDVDPALAALAAVLRPGGVLSLLAANRNAVVLARAISVHFDQARHALETRTAGSVPATRCRAGSPPTSSSGWSATTDSPCAPSTAYAASPTWCPVRSSTPSRAPPTRCSRSSGSPPTTPTSGRSQPSCMCWPCVPPCMNARPQR